MTDDFKFSPAAEEYARNADVVAAMEAEFKRNIDGFLKTVDGLINRRAAGAKLRVSTKTTHGGKYWYWWPGARDVHAAVPNIWFKTYLPSIISNRRILLHLGAATLTPEQDAKVQSLETNDEFASYVAASSHSDAWQRLSLDIELNPNRMADDLAEKVVRLCQLMAA